MAEQRACPYCGSRIIPNNGICPVCGQNVNGVNQTYNQFQRPMGQNTGQNNFNPNMQGQNINYNQPRPYGAPQGQNFNPNPNFNPQFSPNIQNNYNQNEQYVQQEESVQNALDEETEQELRKFNWGAFLMTWIWAIGNKAWTMWAALIGAGIIVLIITGIAYIPKLPQVISVVLLIFSRILSFIVNILCGIFGNRIAWKSKQWDNLEHFRKVQKIWVIVWLILTIISIGIIALLIGLIGLGVIAGLTADTSGAW